MAGESGGREMPELNRDATIEKVRADAEKSCSRWEQVYTDLQEQYATLSRQLEEERLLRPQGAFWEKHGGSASAALETFVNKGGLLAAALACFPERLARFLSFRHLSLLRVNRTSKMLFCAKEVPMVRVIGARRESVLRGIVDTTKFALKDALAESCRQKDCIQELKSSKAELEQMMQDKTNSALDAKRSLQDAQNRFREFQERSEREIKRKDSQLEEMRIRLEDVLGTRNDEDLKVEHTRVIDEQNNELQQLRTKLEMAETVEGGKDVGAKGHVAWEELHFELVTAKYQAGLHKKAMEAKTSELEHMRNRLSLVEYQADSRMKEMQQKDDELEELCFQLKTHEHKNILLAGELEAKDLELARAQDLSGSYLSTLRYKTTGTYPAISPRTTAVRDLGRDDDDQTRSSLSRLAQGAISKRPEPVEDEGPSAPAVFWDDEMFLGALERKQEMSSKMSAQSVPADKNSVVGQKHGGGQNDRDSESWFSSFAFLFARTEEQQGTSKSGCSDDLGGLASSHSPISPLSIVQQVPAPSPQRTRISEQHTPTSTTMRSNVRKTTLIPLGRNGRMIRCPCQMMPPGDTSISCDCSVEVVPQGTPVSVGTLRSPIFNARE